jgi:integrase
LSDLSVAETTDVIRTTRAPSDLTDALRPLAVLINQVIDACVALRVGDGAGGLSASSPQGGHPCAAAIDGGMAVPELVRELLAAKQKDGLSRRYLQTLRSHLQRFAAAFPGSIAEVTTRSMEDWLREQSFGARARNNMRGSVVTLFHFARKQGYLPKGQPTEADDVALAKDVGGDVGILTPVELARILAHAPDNVALFVALGAFTGMRSSEMLRLEWKDINLERRFITVAADKTKTATRRLVPVQPNLMRWLSISGKQVGPLFQSRRAADRAIAFAKGLGVEWPNNALRHSYATYRLAVTADAARVALEMGNSPRKLMTNYRELADEAEATAWFNIYPEPAKNIIALSPIEPRQSSRATENHA